MSVKKVVKVKRRMPASTKGVPKGKFKKRKKSAKQLAQIRSIQADGAKAASIALQGNRFWERRSKHGVDKLFTSPELLWEAACEYFRWCDDNPWVKHEKTQWGLVEVPIGRPYTMVGLCVYLDCNRHYFVQFKNTDRCTDGFASVIDAIEKIVYQQKFEGAAVGGFNANLIARELGLRDAVDVGLSDSRKDIATLFPVKAPKE